MHGHGTYTWADGGTYTGQWANDGREGLGVYKPSPADLTGPYEEKYDGWWRADKMHGQGKYYWSNGDVYDGMWKEDKRHGQGVLACATGVRHCLSRPFSPPFTAFHRGSAAGPIRGRMESRRAERPVRDPTTWNISNKMALITSDCGRMRHPSIKRP